MQGVALLIYPSGSLDPAASYELVAALAYLRLGYEVWG